MKVISRRTAVRLLVLAGLAVGLWWNSTRLNETERKLVGVWERVDATSGERTGVALLPNRTQAYVWMINGKWNFLFFERQWEATPNTLSHRERVPIPRVSWSDWQSYMTSVWYGINRSETPMILLPDGSFILRTRTYRRSTDPELLALFDRLSAGASP